MCTMSKAKKEYTTVAFSSIYESHFIIIIILVYVLHVFCAYESSSPF